MYLNLDLLYNVNNYLYPLFYYKYQYFSNSYEYTVYSPMTKKSVHKNYYNNHNSDITYYDITYYDFITKKYKGVFLAKIFDFDDTDCIFTENTLKYYDSILEKCKPFKLSKKDLYFLKSNTRIN